MSLHEYRASEHIVRQQYPFYALIMAAFAQADTANRYKLEALFPTVAEEFRQRDNAPGGALPGD